MKTFKDLKDEITRIKSIDVKGFDSDWVLSKFARDQALTNIELIKPYTDKYSTIVRFLVTGKDAGAAASAAYAAASDAAYAATSDAAPTAAATAAATYAATYAISVAVAVAAASAVTTYATYAATYATDYTKSIASLKTLANEYLALLT